MRKKSFIVGVLIAVGLIGLAGCTGSAPHTATSTQAAPLSSLASTGISITPTALTSTTKEPDASVTPTPTTQRSGKSSTTHAAPAITPQSLPSSVANSILKRKNVVITSCSATDRGWQAKGVAINKSTSPATYTITVFFTTSQATAVAWAYTHVTVEPGVTSPWTATATFNPADNMLCVLRGVA